MDIPQLILAIERGFVSYSEGRCVVPPVGFLHFDDPPGDVHIKYGYIHGGDYYVLKVVSAFYNNAELNESVNNGVMFLFSSRTGGIEFVLQDDGWLTDIRTAAAGAVAARHLANENIDTIGIVGTGTQAKLQLELLHGVVSCKKPLVWGRSTKKAQQMIDDLYKNPIIQDWGIGIMVADDLNSLVSRSRLIATTTPARSPLIQSDIVQTGTHITAVGSDEPGKQELDSALLAKADRIIADSVSQCIDQGECLSAIKDNHVDENSIIELGDVIKNPEKGWSHKNQITIADLTGVAVQDIAVADMVA